MVLNAFRTLICLFGAALSSHVFMWEIFQQNMENDNISLSIIAKKSAASEIDCARRCLHIAQCMVTAFNKQRFLCEHLNVSKEEDNGYIDDNSIWILWFKRGSLLNEGYGKPVTAATNAETVALNYNTL